MTSFVGTTSGKPPTGKRSKKLDFGECILNVFEDDARF